VLLTTHYLEEAEALCGRIAMLKARPGRGAGPHLASCSRPASSNVLRFKIDGELPPGPGAARRSDRSHRAVPGRTTPLDIETYLAAVRQAGLLATGHRGRKADLEDVFLALMGQAA